MYNENQKRAFIESHTNSDKTMAKIVQIFSWFEPYEEDWGLDLSQQSAEKLQPVVNELTGVRSKSTELILIILKEYVSGVDAADMRLVEVYLMSESTPLTRYKIKWWHLPSISKQSSTSSLSLWRKKQLISLIEFSCGWRLRVLMIKTR